jgi:hypothetical protein
MATKWIGWAVVDRRGRIGKDMFGEVPLLAKTRRQARVWVADLDADRKAHAPHREIRVILKNC